MKQDMTRADFLKKVGTALAATATGWKPLATGAVTGAAAAGVARAQPAPSSIMVVYPTGNAASDTDNIQDAIDNACNGDRILLKARNAGGVATKFVIGKPWSADHKCKMVDPFGVESYLEDYDGVTQPLYQVLSVPLVDRSICIEGEVDGAAKTTITQFVDYAGLKAWRQSSAFNNDLNALWYGAGAYYGLMLASGVPGAKLYLRGLNFEYAAGITILSLADIRDCHWTACGNPQLMPDNRNSYGLSLDIDAHDTDLPLARSVLVNCTLTDMIGDTYVMGSGWDIDNITILSTEFSETMSIEGVLWFPPEFGTMSNRSERDFHLIYMCTVRQEVWPWPGNVYKFGIDTTIKNCHITEEDFPGKSGIDLSTTFAGLCVTSNAGGVMKDVVVQNNTCKDLKSRLWALSVRANAHGTGVSADSLSPRIIENTLDGCWQGLAIEAYHSNLFDAVVTGNRIIDAVDGFGFGGYLGIIAQGGLGGVLSNALLRHNDYSRSGIPPQSRSHNVWNCCLLLMECVNTVIDELGSWPNNKVGIGQWVTAKGGYGNHVVGGGTPAITNTTPLEKPVRVRRIR